MRSLASALWLRWPITRNLASALWLLFFLSVCCGSVYALSSPLHSQSRQNPILRPSTRKRVPFLNIGFALRRDKGVLLVDVENVRGKSGFQLSHKELINFLSDWTQACQLSSGQIVMVVDHGRKAAAYWARDMAVVFAGPSLKADDVIARDIGKISLWTQNWMRANSCDDKSAPVTVVTDDNGLLSRCRKSSARKYLNVVSPLSLLEELENLQHHNIPAEDYSPQVVALLDEIMLGVEWLEAQSKVLASLKKHVPNKRRKALRLKAHELQHELEKSKIGLGIFQFASSVLATAENSDIIDLDSEPLRTTIVNDDMHTEIQSTIMSEWGRRRKSLHHRTYRKEKTDDRVVLSEHFRGELEQYHGTATSNLYNQTQAAKDLNPGQAYVRDWILTHETASDRNSNLLSTTNLRLVCISDTHGFENELGPIPPGDVLLHLGDFSLEGPTKMLSVKSFDHWLSKQPHRYKIVLRGNHDPRSVQFEASSAIYVEAPKTMLVAGYTLALVPHMSRLTTRCLPNNCDVLASHVPPKGVLDECQSGKSAGSNTLRRKLQRMTKLAGQCPKLLLCGHIHEARGKVWHDFSYPAENGKHENGTLVVNVANANSGIAREIQHGPVIIDLSQQKQEVCHKVQMSEDGFDGSSISEGLVARREEYVLDCSPDSSSIRTADEGDKSGSRKLLVIRLGLKTGVSLFDSQKRLILYQHFLFMSLDNLKERAPQILSNFEFGTTHSRIAHIALEGGDSTLREAWMHAVTMVSESEHHAEVIFVDANEWRRAMLTPKERTSWQKSKTATRLIAQRFLACYGPESDSETSGKLAMEVAESIVAGLYLTKRFGWLQEANGADEKSTKFDQHSLERKGLQR